MIINEHDAEEVVGANDMGAGMARNRVGLRRESRWSSDGAAAGLELGLSAESVLAVKSVLTQSLNSDTTLPFTGQSPSPGQSATSVLACFTYLLVTPRSRCVSRLRGSAS